MSSDEDIFTFLWKWNWMKFKKQKDIYERSGTFGLHKNVFHDTQFVASFKRFKKLQSSKNSQNSVHNVKG